MSKAIIENSKDEMKNLLDKLNCLNETDFNHFLMAVNNETDYTKVCKLFDISDEDIHKSLDLPYPSIKASYNKLKVQIMILHNNDDTLQSGNVYIIPV